MTTRAKALERATAGAGERAAWLILAVLLLFSVAAPLNQFKVPPIMPVLMSDLRLSAGGAGLTMSVYALTGLILALPAGFILQRIGFRLTGLLAGGSVVLGTLLGVFATSFEGLLAGRVVEGIGTSFMAVLAPAIITQRFAAHRRGTAMGIWSTWVPVGSTAMLLLAPLLAQSFGWRGVWWFGALYAALVTALYLVVVKPAPAAGSVAAAVAGVADHSASASVSSVSQVLRNRDLWLLSLAFAMMCAAAMGIGTYLPTYLSTVHGLPLVEAALLASIPTMVSIFSGPMGGVISDKVGSRRWPYLIGFVLAALTFPPMAVLGVGALAVLVGVQGVVMGLVPTNIFSAAVEAAGDPRQGGLAMAIIMVGQNAGMLVGPVLFGLLIESAGGWGLAFSSLAVVSLLGALAGGLARVR
ncbi:MAG: MFS transporter [Chloroflexota bacterium]